MRVDSTIQNCMTKVVMTAWVENSCVLKMWWVCGLLVRATKGVPWCTRASDVICLNRKQTHTLAQTHTQTHIHTRSHEH